MRLLQLLDAFRKLLTGHTYNKAKRTLRRLYNEHCKASKELLRRVDQLEAEGKDPSQPQKLDTVSRAPPPRHNSSTQIAGPSRIGNASPQPMRPMSDSQHTPEESFMLLGGQRVSILFGNNADGRPVYLR